MLWQAYSLAEMDSFRTVIKAILWGMSVLSILVFIIFTGVLLWAAIDARVSPDIASEADRTLSVIQPTVEDVSRLRRYADEMEMKEAWKETIEAEGAIRNATEKIESQVEPYCHRAQCIHWYDQRYQFSVDIFKKREAWASDLSKMLERHANPDELRADNRLHMARAVCALVAMVLLLYLFAAYVRFFRIGWQRLLGLTALVAPPVFVLLAFGVCKVDPLYGHLDLSGNSTGAAMIVTLLYPFVVLPPLWVLSRKAGMGALNAMTFWRERQSP